MENPTNPKNSSIRRAQDDAEPAEASKFIEDLQKASQEIEAGFQKKKPISQPEIKEAPKESKIPTGQEIKEKQESLERTSSEGLVVQAEEVAKERKRLEEIQKNLEKNQKIVAECIQELTTLQGEISRALEGKKKIEEDLRRMREKNKKIFEELGTPDSFWFPNK